MEVLWGNPDACIYRFPVTTTVQCGAVDAAKQLVDGPEGAIRPSGVSARQWLRRVYDTLRTIGGFGLPGGPSLRDLKAAGADPPT